MDADLKTHLDAMEARIVDRVTERMGGQIDAMEARIVDRVTERLGGRIDAMEARIVDRVTERLGGRIDAVEDRMKMHVAEAIHTSETKLLAEFWKWARTADARFRQSAGMTSGFGERVTLIEERVAELERGRSAA